MFFSWGEDLFTRVDNARGLFVVRTRFVYFYWLPVLPVQSYLCVLEDNPHRRRRVVQNESAGQTLAYASQHTLPRRKHTVAYLPIPLNGKSLLAAYAMVGGVIATFVTVIASVLLATEPTMVRAQTAVAAATLAVGLFMTMRSRWLSEAGYERAVKLVHQAKAVDLLLERVEREFGVGIEERELDGR